MYWRRAALVGTRLVRVRSSSAGRLEGPAGISGSGMGNSTSSSLGNAATAPVNQIQETISNNCVVIFSKTSCSYCTMAKKLFHDMNVNYKVVELDMLEYGSQFQDALHKMTGERTVPRIFVNGTFIGGATDTHRLHKEGKLLPLVHQCHLKKIMSHSVALCPLCSLPGFSVHGILQARILEWVAVPSSRGSSIEPASLMSNLH
ncbi:glutaredoxin 2 isoform 3-T5 [Dama dama]